MSSKLKTQLRNAAVGLVALALATAIWVPWLHLFFRKPLSDFYQEKGLVS